MAKVMVDASAIGADWFQKVVAELMRLKGPVFVRSLDPQTLGEHQRAKKLGEFYANMSRQGKVITVSAEVSDQHISYLTNHKVWQKTQACDDPHIFAVVHASTVRYVFTGDARIATCRDCLNKAIDKKYCAFSLISSEGNYAQHKDALCR